MPATARFDRFVNGLNRLPRPMLALGTLGLFVYAMAAPRGFSRADARACTTCPSRSGGCSAPSFPSTSALANSTTSARRTTIEAGGARGAGAEAVAGPARAEAATPVPPARATGALSVDPPPRPASPPANRRRPEAARARPPIALAPADPDSTPPSRSGARGGADTAGTARPSARPSPGCNCPSPIRPIVRPTAGTPA